MRKTMFGLLTALVICVPALAAEGDVRGACENDIKSLCPSVQPGGGRIKECVKEHKDQLSANCKRAMFEQRKANQGARSRVGATGAKEAAE